MNRLRRSRPARGFSLTELAIVLLIIGILIGSLLLPLSAQRDAQSMSDTQKQLGDMREALLGFAAANGRLPCPASPGATGSENPAGGGACASPNGFLPAVTLGVAPTDAQGYALDAWGNRIRYSVARSGGSWTYTQAGGLKAAWSSASTLAPDLRVCSTSVGISAAACTAGADLTTGVVAVILSAGKNGAAPPAGADEQANLAGNSTFVSHTPTPTGAPQGEFDDIVIWLSPNMLYNRLIAAGRLP